ncbi:MAG: metal ABC transporter substrate-binding protein [Acutalibacteraceae bacterium]
MKRIISIFISLLILLCTLASCSGKAEERHKLSIVCTTFPQYDFLKNILGSDEGLTLLIDDGADLHSFEPTAQDIIKIGSADLFVYIGGNSDRWVENALKSANNPKLKTLALMDTVDTLEEEYVAGMEREEEEHREAHSGSHAEEDEHIWLSVRNAEKMTSALCDAVCGIDPENAEKYKANADSYKSKLSELDNNFSAAVDGAKRKTLLFADRFPFRYLTEDYGLSYYAAFAGCSSESEASFKTMAFLIDKTKELSLPVVLTIDGSDGSIAKTVCEATGAKTAELNSCQSVTAKNIENGVNYLDIMKNNFEVILEALN